ncbi:hypothetical protein R69658_06860 [Paraburkholderia aspalathi]|uniref:Uncharacterized protein n=1 Tax=Paraburkholderia aspalathi TaxID=1324617 RepID=A0ABM8T0A4_9BURK|nr:hypothetical protein R69658_06860 [Paraburkholderia aspalathi]
MSATDVTWQWNSTQGSTCSENRDACGIYQCETYTFCIVMDASPRGEYGTRFNATWIAEVLDRLSPDAPSEAAVVTYLHEAQRRLRTERFVSERASYIAFLFRHDQTDTSVFHCGDCTLGSQSPEGYIEWLTRTHTLENAYEELGFDVDASKRHILTANANREEIPGTRRHDDHRRSCYPLGPRD